MIAISYVQLDSLRSDIKVFAEKEDAKKWLYDKCGWILDDDVIPNTLEELSLQLYENSVIVEFVEF